MMSKEGVEGKFTTLDGLAKSVPSHSSASSPSSWLVWGVIMYLTSAGDEKRADTAKAIVKWAIIGIAVALASLVLVTQVAKFF